MKFSIRNCEYVSLNVKAFYTLFMETKLFNIISEVVLLKA
jgi:hypothetical protein